jgi:hypothetical protein
MPQVDPQRRPSLAKLYRQLVAAYKKEEEEEEKRERLMKMPQISLNGLTF